MNRGHVLFAGFALAAASGAGAQNVEWRRPIYADVVGYPHARFRPYWVSQDLPLRVMHLSQAGTPGIVVAGGAEIGEYDDVSTPVTPFVAKIATSDGHLLWSWQLPTEHPLQGRVWSTATDVSGAVFIAGGMHAADGELGRFLLAKLDSSTGAALWQVTGPQDTFGYGVAIDAAGDVLLTSSEADYGGQRVSKYSGIDGSFVWSTLMAGGNTDWDDFRIALDADGNALAGGFYVDNSNPEQQVRGAEIGKFRGSDGVGMWRYRNVDPDLFGNVQAIVPAPNGDVIMQGGYVGLARLASADGSVVWQRDDDAFYQSFDLLVDATGRAFTAGWNTSTDIAWLRRIDLDTGATLWQANPAGGLPSIASELALGIDGKLMIGWQLDVFSGAYLMGASVADTESGAIDWTARVGLSQSNYDIGHTVGIAQAPDGSIFVGSYSDDPPNSGPTWTVFKLSSTLTDAMFADGFE